MGKQSSEGFEDAAWHKDYERYRKKFLAEALAEGPLTGEDAFNIVSRAVGAANALKIDRMMMGPEAATFEELEAQPRHIPV